MTTKEDRDHLFATAKAYVAWRDEGPHPLPADDEPLPEHPVFDEFMAALIRVTEGRGWGGAGNLAELIVALEGE